MKWVRLRFNGGTLKAFELKFNGNSAACYRAVRVDDRLHERLKNGEYDKISSAFHLMDALDSPS